jgi:hypothetical protein
LKVRPVKKTPKEYKPYKPYVPYSGIGPCIIRDVPKPSRWQRFVSFAIRFSRKFERKVDAFLWQLEWKRFLTKK